MQQQPPPIFAYRQKIDLDHLRLLAVFHYVFAGFALVGIAFLIGHFLLMTTLFNSPDFAKTGAPMTSEVMAVFRWFYIVMGLICLGGGVLNCVAASSLRAQKNRVFTMVVAGLNCTQIPLGTILGIFTLMVLSRESVKSLYQEP